MPQPNDLRLLAGEARRLASSADTLSIVLADHRRLKNDLHRPSIEEIGSRATIFDLEGSGREKRKFFSWQASLKSRKGSSAPLSIIARTSWKDLFGKA